MNAEGLRVRGIWPGVILGSAVASGLFYFLGLASPFRLMIILWFLLVCPGMAFVRLLKFDETYYEWTLAIALSISLDAIVACLLLYTGLWSIELGLLIVILMSFLGAYLQIRALQRQSDPDQSLSASRAVQCPRCQAETRQTRAGFSRSGRQRYRCGRCKRIYTPNPDRQADVAQPSASAVRMAEKRTMDGALDGIWKKTLQRIANLVKNHAAKLLAAVLGPAPRH